MQEFKNLNFERTSLRTKLEKKLIKLQKLKAQTLRDRNSLNELYATAETQTEDFECPQKVQVETCDTGMQTVEESPQVFQKEQISSQEWDYKENDVVSQNISQDEWLQEPTPLPSEPQIEQHEEGIDQLSNKDLDALCDDIGEASEPAQWVAEESEEWLGCLKNHIRQTHLLKNISTTVDQSESGANSVVDQKEAICSDLHSTAEKFKSPDIMKKSKYKGRKAYSKKIVIDNSLSSENDNPNKA